VDQEHQAHFEELQWSRQWNPHISGEVLAMRIISLNSSEWAFSRAHWNRSVAIFTITRPQALIYPFPWECEFPTVMLWHFLVRKAQQSPLTKTFTQSWYNAVPPPPGSDSAAPPLSLKTPSSCCHSFSPLCPPWQNSKISEMVLPVQLLHLPFHPTLYPPSCWLLVWTTHLSCMVGSLLLQDTGFLHHHKNGPTLCKTPLIKSSTGLPYATS